MPGLVRPHGGGSLRPLIPAGEALAAERARSRSLPALRVSSREKGDLIMLGIGGFTPLEGFMTRADWQGVCDDCRTASGLFWPIPITLSVDAATAGSIRAGADIALADPEDGAVLATMRVTEKYAIDKAHECKSVFRTVDAGHPGVKMVLQQGEVNLAGPVQVLSDGGFKAKYGALFMTPAETRAEFERLGWSTSRRVPDAQSDAPLARVSRQGGDRGLRRRAGALAARQPQAGRHSGRGAHARHRRADRKVLPAGHGGAGGLSARHALRGAARGAAARAVPAELRLLAPDRRARPRGRGQLLRAVRRAPRLRPDPARRARDAAAEDGRDVLVLPLRRHGLGTHLRARRRRTGCRYPARNCANGSRRAARYRRNSADRKCSRSCASTTHVCNNSKPGDERLEVGLVSR